MKSNKGALRPWLNSAIRYRVEFVFIAAVFLLLSSFIISFINQEHLIYFWDSSTYWLKYRQLGDLVRNSPLQALYTIISTVRNHEYNLFPVALLLPTGAILGGTRLGYILNITLLFSFPFILLFAWFFTSRIQSTDAGNSHRHAFLLAVLCLGISPQLWIPVLSGYLDAGGLILATIVLIIYCQKPLIARKYPAILAMALCLCLMVLFRRWYAYWVAGFFFSIAIDNIRYLVTRPRKTFRDHSAVLAKFSTLAIGSVVLFFLLATPIAKTMILTNYGDIYSGYKYSKSFYTLFLAFQAYFGPLTVWSAGLGFVLSLLNTKTRGTAIILFLQFWFSLLLFNNTQNMGPNHYYILVPSLYYFLCYLGLKILETLETRFMKILACTAVIAILAANFAIVFVPAMTAPLQSVGSVLPQVRLYPEKRQDIDEIYNVISYLEGLTQSGGHEIYVLASGHTLNDDILRNACTVAKVAYSVCHRFATVAHVDKRDGLPLNLFQSRYVVTTNPAEFHLYNTADQQVIGKIRTMLINQEGFGANYTKLKAEFILDNNVKVVIYQRLDSPFAAGDLQALSDYFVNLYPEHKEKFQFPPEVLARLTE